LTGVEQISWACQSMDKNDKWN